MKTDWGLIVERLDNAIHESRETRKQVHTNWRTLKATIQKLNKHKRWKGKIKAPTVRGPVRKFDYADEEENEDSPLAPSAPYHL
jgi:hypothetical protein